jgi:predicted translin family RNA/ssDNA-binding protein
MKTIEIFNASKKLIEELKEKLQWVKKTKDCSTRAAEFIDAIILYDKKFRDDILGVDSEEIIGVFNHPDFLKMLGISNFLGNRNIRELRKILLFEDKQRLKKSLAFGAIDVNLLIREEYEILCNLL